MAYTLIHTASGAWHYYPGIAPSQAPVGFHYPNKGAPALAGQSWQGYNWRWFSFDDCPPTERPPAPAVKCECECGATATYGAGSGHSDWCPLAASRSAR